MFGKFILFATIVLFSFGAAYAQHAVNIPFKAASRYFVKNTVKTDELQTLKITDKETFANMFGMAAIMGRNGQPTTVDFEKQFVLAVAGQATDIKTEITPVNLKKDGNKLIFEYEIRTTGAPRSFTIVPCLIILVDNKYKHDEVRFKADYVKSK